MQKIDPNEKKINDALKAAQILCQYKYEKINLAGNNTVYVIKLKKFKLIAKIYHDEKRLLSEISYLNLISPYSNKVQKLISYNLEDKIALLSYIDGERPSVSSIEGIDQTLLFLSNTNNQNIIQKIDNINPAKDAIFSAKEYAEILKNRIDVLLLYKKCHNSELSKYFDILKNCQDHINNLKIEEKISFQKLLSPSDLGFHNMLVCKNEFYFIDFEYAGIDSFAKLINDFFLQPKIPVDLIYRPYFIKKISSTFNFINQEKLNHEVNSIEKLSIIKWLCICLNILIPENLYKREIASGKNQALILKEQLDTAIFFHNRLIYA